MDIPKFIERLKSWSDAKHTCTECGSLEPCCQCNCHGDDGNGHGMNWAPTSESEFIDEAVAIMQVLFNFAEKTCPKCDRCGELLLGGGIVLSDGLHGKPVDIVCAGCYRQDDKEVEPETQENTNWAARWVRDEILGDTNDNS
jgi:hypothetical protein